MLTVMWEYDCAHGLCTPNHAGMDTTVCQDTCCGHRYLQEHCAPSHHDSRHQRQHPTGALTSGSLLPFVPIPPKQVASRTNTNVRPVRNLPCHRCQPLLCSSPTLLVG